MRTDRGRIRSKPSPRGRSLFPAGSSLLSRSSPRHRTGLSQRLADRQGTIGTIGTIFSRTGLDSTERHLAYSGRAPIGIPSQQHRRGMSRGGASRPGTLVGQTSSEMRLAPRDESMGPRQTRPVAKRAASRRRRSSGVIWGGCECEGTGHLGGCAPAAFASRPACWRNDRRTLYLSTTPTAREVSDEVLGLGVTRPGTVALWSQELNPVCRTMRATNAGRIAVCRSLPRPR